MRHALRLPAGELAASDAARYSLPESHCRRAVATRPAADCAARATTAATRSGSATICRTVMRRIRAKPADPGTPAASRRRCARSSAGERMARSAPSMQHLSGCGRHAAAAARAPAWTCRCRIRPTIASVSPRCQLQVDAAQHIGVCRPRNQPSRRTCRTVRSARLQQWRRRSSAGSVALELARGIEQRRAHRRWPGAQQLGGAALLHDAALLQHQHAVRDAARPRPGRA